MSLAREMNDQTALHVAAATGNTRMARLLLAYGADKSIRGSDNLTPADIAARYRYKELEKLLR